MRLAQGSFLLLLLHITCAAATCGRFQLWCPTPSACPPPGFDTVPDFDIDRYISAPWYVQEQMPVVYQPVEELFCVRAEYKYEDPYDKSKGLIVLNYANKGAVNGPPTGTNGVGGNSSPFAALRALIRDPADASKISVGPAVLQQALGESIASILYGPYWVVAVGPDYEWAIISGGAPKLDTGNGCISGKNIFGSVRGNGLWLFSRHPVDPYNTEVMRHKAEELGFDISVLANVEQEGCLYEGAL